MDLPTCGLINMPIVFLNLVPNMFFIFCMICPLHGEIIKQPLKLLLGSLICCTVTYLVSVPVLFFNVLTDSNSYFIVMSQVVALCSLATSMTSSVWLNFFYCTQIVPAQRAIFVWIKKNVKSIIFIIWLVERIHSLLYAVVIADSYTLTDSVFDGFTYNFTTRNITIYSDFYELRKSVYVVMDLILKAHFALCMCVMVMSSSLTAVYLCRHMRRMVANGQCLSCPRLRSQVRVTVTGILQGILYMFCAVWSMFFFFSSQYRFIYTCAYYTVFNFYMSGTTFNLGAGQAVFRQRAADIWQRAARWCKAPRVQQSEPEGPDTGEVSLGHL